MTRPLKTKLATLDQLDGRTIAAKQARALMADIESDLGGRDELSTAELQLIQRARFLVASRRRMRALKAKARCSKSCTNGGARCPS